MSRAWGVGNSLGIGSYSGLCCELLKLGVGFVLGGRVKGRGKGRVKGRVRVGVRSGVKVRV